jgi:Bifunctional DNA primase/polymerase, N-terminal/AAA domain
VGEDVRTPDAPANENLQAALSYAERGWLVFPVHPADKTPVTDNGLHDATQDEETIRQWWARWPGAMVAVQTGPASGIWALDLDIDAEEKIDGVTAFAALAKSKEPIPETFRTRTPRGGSHLFFAWHDGVRNSASQIAPGVDVRGLGGYCVLPPSTMADGKRYQCLGDVCPDLPAAPQWLIDLLTANNNAAPSVDPQLANFARAAAGQRSNGGGNGKGYGATALDDECAKVANAPKGQRNHALNRAAFNLGQLVGGNVLAESDVRAQLLDAASACGLVQDDGRAAALATISSGLAAGLKQPRTPSATIAASGRPLQPLSPTPSSQRFKLTRFNQVSLSSTAVYLIYELIPLGGLIVIWGPPKCGKSFWAFDAFMHVALGWPYRGRKVQQGEVVYLALEGGRGFSRRVEAFRKRHEITDAPFYLITDRTNLGTDHRALIAAVRTQSVKPAAVVIDTLNRSLAGSENKDEDMGSYLRAADSIREAFDCAVVIIHHCGINENRPRGHTSLTGAADAQLAVKRDLANNVVVELEWLKDGAENSAAIISKLERVEIGHDEDGIPLTSCVVVPSTAAADSATAEQLTKNQKTMFSILYDAGSRGLTAGEWNSAARDAEIGTKRKADLYDLRTALHARKLVYESNGRWFAKRS